MPASRFLQRRRSRRSNQCKQQEGVHPDMLSRKTLICDELARIDAIVERLRHRRRIGPDMSSDDLIELFREERDRLFTQLCEVDAALNAEDAQPPAQDAQVIELRPRSAVRNQAR